MSDVMKLKQALLDIAEIAGRAAAGLEDGDVRGDGYSAGNGHDEHDDHEEIYGDDSGHDHAGHTDHGEDGHVHACSIRSLPPRLLHAAADTARRINPVNATVLGSLKMAGLQGVLPPQAISVLTAKYWGNQPRVLTVTFLEPTSPELRARIISHMNAWTRTCCISFVETRGAGHVRISRGGEGYWSYLGTDILHIPSDRPTMNLQGFTMSTSESEFHRVVRHETGHTLGFPHEHMRKGLIKRIDRMKAYAYFLETQGWDAAMVDQQVLTSLDERSLMSTPPDQTSIMCYQLPASITLDGQPITGGVDINQSDYAFAGKIYPRRGAPNAVAANTARADWVRDDDWGPAHDVTPNV